MRTLAKRRFGQHFLRDTGVLDRIVRLVQPMPEDILIEIGAGDGALSAKLAPAVGRLLAVEIDMDCVRPLKAALSLFPSAHVIQGDILELNLEELVREHLRPGSRLRAVGNLPYNIATPTIQKLLQLSLPITDMVLMVQLEVAERITASPGSRRFGLLSIQCQHLSRVWMAFKVSPACFVPRPKVTSAVITIRPLSKSGNADFEACLLKLAKAAFSHRRKTLANSLRLDPVLGTEASALLAEAGIDGSRRPEDLSVKEYEHLADTQLRLMRGDVKSGRSGIACRGSALSGHEPGAGGRAGA
jgi:16S rRNA (adenine1518-N6/adenine1519-N6)-dimethyltransferase